MIWFAFHVDLHGSLLLGYPLIGAILLLLHISTMYTQQHIHTHDTHVPHIHPEIGIHWIPESSYIECLFSTSCSMFPRVSPQRFISVTKPDFQSFPPIKTKLFTGFLSLSLRVNAFRSSRVQLIDPKLWLKNCATFLIATFDQPGLLPSLCFPLHERKLLDGLAGIVCISHSPKQSDSLMSTTEKLLCI